ncbi:MAG: hypothetical protein PF488_00730 [Patescibacteria group bacterium]|jgi:hypothetical protein|nr:hypothetical protein [Patescibacteria group bacterium]
MKKLILIITLALFTFIALPVNAQGVLTDKSGVNDNTADFAANANLSDKEIGSVVASLIGIVLGFLALIFLILTIVSGFQWMTAGGNEEVVTKARKRLINSVIGLIIVLAAYGITYFLFTKLPFSGGTTFPQVG